MKHHTLGLFVCFNHTYLIDISEIIQPSSKREKEVCNTHKKKVIVAAKIS